MKIFIIIIIGALASSISFLVHVLTIEWLPQWISNQMQGIETVPSWHVKYIALISSIEYGLAAIAIYHFARNHLIKFGRLKAFMLFSMLLASINGSLIRQPLMDFIVGNPLNVALVQNFFKWLVWIAMSFVVVYGYEIFIKQTNSTNE